MIVYSTLFEMACCGSQLCLYDDVPVAREGFTEAGMLSMYDGFWKGCDWELFIIPEHHSGVVEQQWKVVGSALKAHAAVYEFAVTARVCPQAKIPVYVGESTNVQNRHRDYGKDGSSLREYFEEYVARRRLLLWRRTRYVRDKGQAERWEARFLISYDYAWNAKLNMAKRDINVSMHSCMWCCVLGVLVQSASRGRRTTHAVILTKPVNVAVWYTHLLCCMVQTIVSVSMISIVAIHLTPDTKCALTKPYACSYTYAVGAVNIALSIVLLSILALGRSPAPRGLWIIGFVCLLGMCVCMLVFSIVFTDAQTTAVGTMSWKIAVEVMGWVSLGSWGVQSCAWLLNTMLSCGGNPCACASPV